LADWSIQTKKAKVNRNKFQIKFESLGILNDAISAAQR